MRIKVDQPESANIEAILLDGKRLPTCVEADDQEGWVTVLVPPARAPDNMPTKKGEPKVAFVGDPIEPSEWVTKKLTGDVEIILLEREGLEDDGLDN